MNSLDYSAFNDLPEFSHVCPVQNTGAVFSIDGIAPDIRDIDVVASSSAPIGDIARLHTNGDLFVLIDNAWRRVYSDSVRFEGNTTYYNNQHTTPPIK